MGGVSGSARNVSTMQAGITHKLNRVIGFARPYR